MASKTAIEEKLLMLQQAEIQQKQVRLWERMLSAPDPESLRIFLFYFARTKDPHDPDNPVKPFPRKQYLEDLIDEWTGNRHVLIAKSRQIICTWSICAFYTWDAFKYPARFTFFQSRELGDAGLDREYALLWRTKFIRDCLPEAVRPRIRERKKLQMIEWPDTGSTFMAVSADFDGFRSYAGTGVFADEMAMQAHAEAAFMAAMPTLGTMGRFTGISTPNGADFFKRKVMDEA